MNVFTALIKLLVLTIFCTAGQAYAQDSNVVSKILWERDFSCGDNLCCSPGAATFNEIDNTLLIVGTSFRLEEPFYRRVFTDGKFRLWEITQDGEMIANTVLKEVPQGIPAKITRAPLGITGLTLAEDGDVRAVGLFEGVNPAFLKANQAGANMSLKSISEKNLREDNILILKMANLPDNNFLLLGRDSSVNGLIIKVDSEGNRFWKKTYSTGRMSFFTDGVSLGNEGCFVVVGSSGDYCGKTLLGPSEVWVFLSDARGNILSEERFPGRYPQVCRLDSGDIVVLYDRSAQLEADYRIRAFSPGLKATWERQFPGKLPLDAFKIRAIPGHGFAIAGREGAASFVLYEYDEKGNKLSSISMEKKGVSPYTTSFVCTEDKAFIVLQVLPKNKEHRTFEMRVIAIELTKLK